MRSTDSLVKIGKWSDGEQWVTDRDGASEEYSIVLLSRGNCICTVSFHTVLYCIILCRIVCPIHSLFYFCTVFFCVFCLSGK